MYRLLSHTADIGIVVSAPTERGLFEASGEAFCKLVFGRGRLKCEIERRIEISRDDRLGLLQGFLSELVYLFETRGELYPVVRVESLTDTKLATCLSGEKIDLARRQIKNKIKAVTYHQLSIDRTKTGWQARIIFDV